MRTGLEEVRFRVQLAIEMSNTFICLYLDIILVFSCTLSYAIFVYETIVFFFKNIINCF